MKILGISPDVWISSAAIVEDGVIVAASPEERFNREKMSQRFPFKSIEYCLEEAKTSFEEIDYVAMPWNPGVHLQSASLRYSNSIRWRGEYLYSIPSSLLNRFHFPKIECMEEKLIFSNNKELSILFVDHHLSHCGNGFLLSPFEEAAILTIDGRGESETCVLATGQNNNINKIETILMPHSLGLFYGAITEYLGFKPDSDEWKVMALASYGEFNNEYYKKINKIVKLKENGTFEFNLSYFNYFLFDKQPTMYSDKLLKLLGPERKKSDEVLNEKYIQIAAAAQQMFEECVVHMVNNLYKKTKSTNLVLSGGCAMNSVLNGKILDLTPFENLFVSSCPDDSGTSIGAALYVYNCMLKNKRAFFPVHNYWGKAFSNDDIKEAIEKYKVKSDYCHEIEKVTAKLISEGKLIGWFQGRMEFGQRALGNRSILADPRSVESKELVNRAVKYRETFRPFAPSILEEYVNDYFKIYSGVKVPFMEKVFKIKDEKRESIPAVVHVDGSGRLQTVSKSTNPLYYSLINEFRKLTNIPVVLNTSFNLNGEPIVCTPTDAIRTFFSCGLDCLVMGNYLVKKAI